VLFVVEHVLSYIRIACVLCNVSFIIELVHGQQLGVQACMYSYILNDLILAFRLIKKFT
jgi:hypothetical protein